MVQRRSCRWCIQASERQTGRNRSMQRQRHLILTHLAASVCSHCSVNHRAGVLPALDHDFANAAFFSQAEARCLGPWAHRHYTETIAELEHAARSFRVMAKAMSMWEATMSIFGPDGSPTPKEIRWAMAVFRTRSFNLPYDGHALVPWLDMLNHKPSRGLPALWNVQGRGVYLVTLVDVQKDGEVMRRFRDNSDRQMYAAVRYSTRMARGSPSNNCWPSMASSIRNCLCTLMLTTGVFLCAFLVHDI